MAPSDEAGRSPTHALGSGRSRVLDRLRAVMVLALLLPTIAYIVAAYLLYEKQLADARIDLDRAARVGAEHARKLFDTNEMLLQRMADLFDQRGDAELLQNGATLHGRLKRMAASLPHVQGLFAFGADGRMLATNLAYPPARHIDYTDRPWFKFHRSGNTPTFFTAQIASRLTGEAVFDMSQRRASAEGSFAGTLHVSLRPESLTEFYKNMAWADSDLRMAVLRDDGALVARWPDPTPHPAVPADDALMQQIAAGRPTGEVDAPSPWEPVRSLSNFRKVADLPLYVVASVDRSTVIGEWRKTVTVLAVFVFPTAIGFAAMAWLALKRTRDELDTEQRLEDETARRLRAEVGLVRSQKLEAIGRLTGGVAHDFNNLLAVVGNSVEVLRRLHPHLSGTRQIDAMDRAVNSGVKLTRQLLAFARTQAVLPERLVLQERLASVVELIQPLLGSSIRCESHVAPDTAPIEVDLAEFELALMNLAVNASDAMVGHGSLRLAARNARPEDLPPGLSGAFVLIDVDDSGPGITAEVASQAFEPFFTTKPIGKGTGLGLSQVRGFCQSTGGDALIEQAPDGGARVRLLLRQSESPAPVAVPAALPAGPLQARVLVVEDNADVALALAELLTTLGCSTRHAADASEAKRLIEAEVGSFDVVLSDVEMPGSIDGIALAEWVRDTHPRLPVILMTGYAPRLEQATQQDLPVLPKPCSAAVLSEAILRVMEAST